MLLNNSVKPNVIVCEVQSIIIMVPLSISYIDLDMVEVQI